MKLPEHWEGIAAGAILAAVGFWAFTGRGGHAPFPPGSEDLQMDAYPIGLPSEFMHWSPVSWAGRSHPYPTQWCGQISSLIDRQQPDYADLDR
jgi:hypothetical protein